MLDERSCHSDLQKYPQIFVISNALLIGTESWSLNMNLSFRIIMCIIDQTYITKLILLWLRAPPLELDLRLFISKVEILVILLP